MENKIDNFLEVEKLLKKKKLQKIFVISGKNSFYKTGAEKLFFKILKNKEHFLYLKKGYLPDFSELINIIKLKDNYKPDLIIAIGGGCAMDLAKISSVFDYGKDLKKRVLNNDFSKTKTKVLAIPTTAGSGAEVTSNAVIYINNLKYSVEGLKLKPDFFSLIPKLLLSSKKPLDASAGFDAISQSVESLFSQKSNNVSIFFARNALKVLLKNTNNFIKNKNIYNAYQMALGANLSGKAINISKTIAPHALSYSFTTMYGVPHGHAVSLSLNKILKFNYFNQDKADCNFDIKKRYEYLFKLTKSKNIYELDFFFKKLKKNIKLEQNFDKLGINLKRDSKKIFSNVNQQRLKNNPVKILKSDIPIIFNKY
jgi:alcohol dehydrogenase